MSRRLVALILAVLGTLLAGCSGSEEPGTGGSDPAGTTIEITFAEGDVTPKGERVEVEHGQPVRFDISADEPGTLHVHTTPEQEIEYAAGDSTHEITVDQPGVVEVESHELDLVLVQLQVS